MRITEALSKARLWIEAMALSLRIS
jgi:hypothetical protein